MDKKYLVVGGLIGAVLGVSAVWLLMRNAPGPGKGTEPPGIRDLLNLSRGLLEVVRQLVDIRERLPIKPKG